MPAIQQYLQWVQHGDFAWTTMVCQPGWWLLAVNGTVNGTLLDMAGDPGSGFDGVPWQLLSQIDMGTNLPKWRVWARKVTEARAHVVEFNGRSDSDVVGHLLIISGLRDATDASDVFVAGAASGTGTSQAVSAYQPDDTGTNLGFVAWLSSAVANYTLPGALTANGELDGTASTSGSGTASLTGYGPRSFTATSTVSVPWAAVTVVGRAPSAGSVTFPNTPLRVRAQIAPGADPGQDPATWAGLWTDITRDVQPRDGGVTVTRGRQDETAQVTPSTMSLVVDNTAGRYVQLNPLSPYYGLLTKNLPVQLWVDPGDGWRLRYRGFISEYPPRSQGGQVDEHMPLEAAGVTRRLSRGRVLNSPLYRQIIAKGGLSGYWPLETDLASGLGGPTMRVVSGAFTFGADGPPGSAGAISSGTGNGIATAAVVGMPDVDGWIVSWWLTVPPDFNTASDTSVVATWSTPGSKLDRWLCYMNPSSPGNVIIGAFTVGSQVLAATSVNLVGSGPYHMVAVAQPSGSNVSFGLQVTDSAGVVVTHQTGGTITSDVVSPITSVGVNASADLVGSDLKGAISHLMVKSDAAPTSSDLWGADLELLPAGQGYAGERAADRVRRLSAEEGTAVIVVGDDGTSEPMGPQPSARFIEILQDVEDTDGGMLYERRDGRLAYQIRSARYNASPALTMNYASGDVATPFEPTDDDQAVVNDVTASRQNGGAARVLDAGHVAGNGQYADSVTLNVADDDQLPDQAGWRVHEGTADGLRYPAVSPNLNGRAAAILPAWIGLDVGQPAAITNPGRDLPPGTINVVVEGYTETIDVVSWTATANCSPGDPWTVLILDSATLGVLDTAGSSLSAGVTATATTISVQTSSGPLWTTQSTDRPFTITVGGETMTVTNVTGASSPQTFTVTRSVNGIVKAHTAGEDVRLATPPILSF